MALCIPAVGESDDCAKAVISLERSNSFPWPEDCVQIHQTLFPRRGWGLGTRLEVNITKPWGSISLVDHGPDHSLRSAGCIYMYCITSSTRTGDAIHPALWREWSGPRD